MVVENGRKKWIFEEIVRFEKKTMRKFGECEEVVALQSHDICRIYGLYLSDFEFS